VRASVVSLFDFTLIQDILKNVYESGAFASVKSGRESAVSECNYHNSGHYPSSLFKTRLNSVGLSVPHRKHIMSHLRAQQVNAVYRFVTMVY
jgi:hypothetical protein